MGSSKIIMLSGVYLILGYYLVGFYQVERTNSHTVEAVANSVQAEQLARTGVNLSMTRLGEFVGSKAFTSQTASMSGGTITYVATAMPGSYSQVTSTAVFNGRTIIITAVMFHNGDRWVINRTYVTPTKENIS
jgi:hypothetical protein